MPAARRQSEAKIYIVEIYRKTLLIHTAYFDELRPSDQQACCCDR